ncbi:hypothetical protein [Sphingomonas sp.]|uniref:hypothetical protein n=1 Tax=Sphingomonas sp. TaxID=28214 RepID=UPI003F6F89DE
MPAPVFNFAIDKRAPTPVEIVIVGPDYSDADFLMEWRNLPGDTGTAVLSLDTQTAGTEGISAAYDAAYEFVDADGAEVTAPATIITVQVDEATAEALSLGTPSKSGVQLSYDLHITPDGGTKFVALRGTVTIDPGTTIG